MMIGWCPVVRSFSVAQPFRPALSAELVGGDCTTGSARGDRPRGCLSAEELVDEELVDCADPRRPPLKIHRKYNQPNYDINHLSRIVRKPAFLHMRKQRRRSASR